MAPNQNQSAVSGRTPSANGVYDTNIIANLNQHMNGLPKIQKAFVNYYLTAETATLLGIIAGVEVYDYFKKFVDPNKMIVVVPRNQNPQGQQALQQDKQAQNLGSAPQGQNPNAAQAPAGTTPQVAQPTQS